METDLETLDLGLLELFRSLRVLGKPGMTHEKELIGVSHHTLDILRKN